MAYDPYAEQAAIKRRDLMEDIRDRLTDMQSDAGKIVRDAQPLKGTTTKWDVRDIEALIADVVDCINEDIQEENSTIREQEAAKAAIDNAVANAQEIGGGQRWAVNGW